MFIRIVWVCSRVETGNVGLTLSLVVCSQRLNIE